MKTTDSSATKSTQGAAKRTAFWRLKRVAVVLLFATAIFAMTGCYEDPRYYGHRPVRAGYYANYGAPAPYYGYEPYPYGYGYGSGVAIGVSSYRGYPRYGRRPYYRDYGGSGYYRRYDGGRRYDGERRRSWERRGPRDRRRSLQREDRRERNRAIRRSAAPDERARGPVDTQPE